MGFRRLETLRNKTNLLVIDNSVIMRWLVGDGSENDKLKATQVLKATQSKTHIAVVPNLWVYEASNVISSYVRREQLSEAIGLTRLSMPFEFCSIVDFEPSPIDLASISIELGLASYDATYLLLAERLKCPMATLDNKLQKIANKRGCQLFTS